MPSIEAVEKFKEEIFRLARETEVLKTWGENRNELITNPVQSQNQVLTTTSDDFDQDEEEFDEASSDEDLEFSNLLDQLPIDEQETREFDPSEEASEFVDNLQAGTEEGFDLSKAEEVEFFEDNNAKNSQDQDSFAMPDISEINFDKKNLSQTNEEIIQAPSFIEETQSRPRKIDEVVDSEKTKPAQKIIANAISRFKKIKIFKKNRGEKKGDEEELRSSTVSLNEKQIEQLQETLLSLPLNLRVAIEKIIISNKFKEVDRSKLVWALVDNKDAEILAKIASKILDHPISIPKDYFKFRGRAFEDQKKRLSYIFIHSFLPIAAKALALAVVIIAAAFLSYKYIYIPIVANTEYRNGYYLISKKLFPESQRAFERARNIQDIRIWYLRYARAYAEKMQYLLAEEKYSQLIYKYPKDVDGLLEWAKLLKDQLKYDQAVKVLKGVSKPNFDEESLGLSGLLSWDYFNKNGLLLLGDINLEWGDEDARHYEDARLAYARLIEHYGNKDEFLASFLRYLIRTNKIEDVQDLKNYFLKNNRMASINSEIISELASYLMKIDSKDNIEALLKLAIKKNRLNVLAHFKLAELYKSNNNSEDEKRALGNVIAITKNKLNRTKSLEEMYILSLAWMGKIYLNNKEFISAEQILSQASAELEDAIAIKKVKNSESFGEIYALLADIYYSQNTDMDNALRLYKRAEEAEYKTADTYYKQAYIYFEKKQYVESLAAFLHSEDLGEKSEKLKYGQGLAYLNRGDYILAQSSFDICISMLEEKLRLIGQTRPEERSFENEILQLEMQAKNNRGIARYFLGLASGHGNMASLAASDFGEAAKNWQYLNLSGVKLEGQNIPNLGLENFNTLLQSNPSQELKPYSAISKDR